MDEDEMLRMNEAFMQGEKYTPKGERITEYPAEFKKWEKAHKTDIAKARSRGTEPYFIRNNAAVIDGILKPKKRGKTIVKDTPAISITEEARLRHKKRTEQQERDIQRKWTLRRAKIRHRARTDEETGKQKLKIWDWQLAKNNPNLTEAERKAISQNWLEIEKALGIKKGRMMTIEEADKQSANPNFGKGKEYRINCQTRAPAYMLRLWGFDVKAKGNTAGSLSEYLSQQHSFEAWNNIDGSKSTPVLQQKWLEKKEYKQMTKKRWKQYFVENCKVLYP